MQRILAFHRNFTTKHHREKAPPSYFNRIRRYPRFAQLNPLFQNRCVYNSNDRRYHRFHHNCRSGVVFYEAAQKGDIDAIIGLSNRFPSYATDNGFNGFPRCFLRWLCTFQAMMALETVAKPRGRTKARLE